MKIFNHDGHIMVVMTTGDIKDVRDCNDMLTINYTTEIKPTLFYRFLIWLGLRSYVKPIRCMSFANERSYSAYIARERNKVSNGGKK